MTRRQRAHRRRAVQSRRDARKRTGRKLPWFYNPIGALGPGKHRLAIDEALR